MRLSLLACLGFLAAVPVRAAENAEPDRPAVEKGSFRFAPVDDQKDVPERYRLAEAASTLNCPTRPTCPAPRCASAA